MRSKLALALILLATAADSASVQLTWTASTDNVGVAGYKIRRGGSIVANVSAGSACSGSACSYVDSGLAGTTQYSYTVSAYDAAGNESAQTVPASVTTNPDGSASDPLPAIRKTDWSYTGVPGGIPHRTTICATFSPGATAAAINAAINSCNNGVVFLNAGTYTAASLGDSIVLNRSNVTLRGAGADQTILRDTAFSMGAGGNTTLNTAITNGFKDGHTFTAASTSGISVGDMIELDRDGDNDSFVNAGHGTPDRAMTQVNVITAINGNVVTVRNPLYYDFSTGNPKIVYDFYATTQLSGLEDLKLERDMNSIYMPIQYCDSCWIKGVHSAHSTNYHFLFLGTVNLELRDNYIDTGASGPNNSGFNFYGSYLYGTNASAKIENNIFQKNFPAIEINATGGLYIGYNFSYGSVDQFGVGGVTWTLDDGHGPFNSYNLYEGNIAEMFGMDGYFGGASYAVVARNYITGWNRNYNVAGDAIQVRRLGYYYSLVGNVLSSSEANPTGYGNGCAGGNPAIYNLGYPNIGSCDTTPYDGFSVTGGYPDAKVTSTLLRWGNYDYFNHATRWQSSEIPAGVPVPGSQTVPASYVYTSKPAWWPSGVAWPPIGPDVTGGTGDSSGHVVKTPAQLCWESRNLVGGGSFNAAACYGS